MKNKRLLRRILNVVSSFIIILLFLITFVDAPFIPTWKEIFKIRPEIDKEADIISFIDVGQGDCILIQSNGRFALIDTGEGKKGDIIRTFKQKGIVGFDAVILSHWHTDHCGEVEDLFKNFKVLNALFTVPASQDDEAKSNSEEVIALCNKKGINTHTLEQAMVINIGDFELTVIYCDNTSANENNRSAIIMAECRDRKFLLTGDAELQTEKAILQENINIECDVLKIAHHGSDTSSDYEFLKAADAKHCVISVGIENSYGHPSQEVMTNIYLTGSQIYRTDYDGTVHFTVEDSEISVTTQR